MPKPTPTPYSPTLPPGEAEHHSVHQVYEAIAPHFSSTRYKPWPLVARFLDSLPPHTLGLDSGAGNGKYVPLARARGREVLALDMSWGLLRVARGAVETQTECLRGELGFDGWRARVFDWAISIAAIHHLSTPERRAQGVQALLNALALNGVGDEAPYSRFMIYVWAFEQGQGSKRRMGKRAEGEGTGGEDQAGEAGAEGQSDAAAGRDGAGEITSGLAGLSTQETTTRSVSDKTADTAAQQHSHSPQAASGTSDGRTEAQAEAQASNPRDTIVQDVLVPWVLQPKPGTKDTPAEEPKVFHRYYHLFVRGELRELVETAARADGYAVLPPTGAGAGEVRPGDKWVSVVKEGWEADNWWVEGEVGVGPRRG